MCRPVSWHRKDFPLYPDQTSFGKCPVILGTEAMEHRLDSGRIDPEHDADAHGATLRCSSVEVAGSVANQSRVRLCSVAARERVQDGESLRIYVLNTTRDEDCGHQTGCAHSGRHSHPPRGAAFRDTPILLRS